MVPRNPSGEDDFFVGLKQLLISVEAARNRYRVQEQDLINKFWKVWAITAFEDGPIDSYFDVVQQTDWTNVVSHYGCKKWLELSSCGPTARLPVQIAKYVSHGRIPRSCNFDATTVRYIYQTNMDHVDRESQEGKMRSNSISTCQIVLSWKRAHLVSRRG